MIQDKTVKTCKPVEDLGAILVGAVKGAKNKEPVTQIIGEQLNNVIQELGEFSQISGDLASSEEAFDNSIALFTVQLKLALLPPKAPAAVAAPASS